MTAAANACGIVADGDARTQTSDDKNRCSNGALRVRIDP
jgi:hypothetical protein